MTPLGDIELEIVFRVALRGRTSDLAQLLEAMNKAGAVVMWLVEEPTASEEQGQKDVRTTVDEGSPESLTVVGRMVLATLAEPERTD